MRQSSQSASTVGGNCPQDRRTPHQPRSGAALAELIRSLDNEFQLGLPVRDETWSPRNVANSLADKVYGRIKYLYFSNQAVIWHTVDELRHRTTCLTQKERLDLFHLLLRTGSSSPHSARTGPRTPRDEAHRSFCQTPCQLPQALHQDQTLSSVSASLYATAPRTRSRIDDEGDDWAPPSPTQAIRAVQRNGVARHQSPSRTVGKKRLSYDSDTSNGTSPKLTKSPKKEHSSSNQTVSGYVGNHESCSRILFKNPAGEMAQSYQSTSAQAPFTVNATWSSQQTQTGTAKASFLDETKDMNPATPNSARKSSVMISSLDDRSLVKVVVQVEKERPHQTEGMARKVSTFSISIDGDEMSEASTRCEGPVRTDVKQYPSSAVSPRGVAPYIPDPNARASSIRETLEPISPVRRPPSPASRSSVPNHTMQQESPPRMSYHIRNIPSQGLFVDDIDDSLAPFPFFILFICQRLAIEHSIPIKELMHGLDVDQVGTDSDLFWNQMKKHLKLPPPLLSESKKIWSATKENLDGYTFKGSVSFNTSRSTPVFKIGLVPLQQEISCRFQRGFGTDRFIYLTFPSFDSGTISTRFNQTEKKQIHEQWKLWLCHQHEFLGRKWEVFHVEPIKRDKGSHRDGREVYGARVILFATMGFGIKRNLSVGEMLNWFFPFHRNLSQTICKAFARIDLGLSRTVPTLVFNPTQIIRVRDRRSDGTPEDTRFDDPCLHWTEIMETHAMNDGCSLISFGAAQEIWRIYRKKTGIHERMPTAFQARIAGAKGLWVVSPDSNSQQSTPSPIWIQISDSQLKFESHPDDMFLESYEPARLTFEIVNHSTSPTSSNLHISFIPIMVDRGVSTEAIQKIILDRLVKERASLLNMLPDPAQIYRWVYQNGWGTQNSADVSWQAALPSILGDRIKLLLENGFHPTEEPYLGKSLCRFVKKQQIWEEQKLRIPLGKATYLYGIADPFGVLAPGEIHVQFSSWFIDDMTDEGFLCLDRVDALVARQPACRRSDLQKVRAICHPKLGHLIDVVVFPTRGQFPQAGKLQGGDYDGDIFWVCWEPDLVGPFKNAPAPTQPLEPAQYGIRQHNRTIKDVIDLLDLSSVKSFLKEAIVFRTAPSLLGRVTKYLEKQAYSENCIYSRTLDALCDMHDLLVDAPKQGYAFTDEEFDATKKSLRLPKFPQTPIYKEAMEACAKAKEMGEAERIRSKDWCFNPDNVIDHLYFNVVRKHNVETQRLIEAALSKEIGNDAVLQYPYHHERQKQTVTIDYEMKRLKVGLDSVYHEWNKGMMKKGDVATADDYNETVSKCYDLYRALVPEQIDAPEIKPWLEPYLSPDISTWMIIKASALYTEYPRKAAMVFHMAGKELADLKCSPMRSSRRVCGSIFSILKPKMRKIPLQLEETDSDDEFFTPREGDS